MTSSIERTIGDDDLSRQRRKRDARLLDQRVAEFPAMTLADVVADVLAASDGGREALDVPGYLAAEGHGWRTIESVVGYLQRQGLADPPDPQQLRLP
ncbi:MAG TPA: hypothetical protein VGJ86_02125 [Acidimicrobiales bacterium]